MGTFATPDVWVGKKGGGNKSTCYHVRRQLRHDLVNVHRDWYNQVLFMMYLKTILYLYWTSSLITFEWRNLKYDHNASLLKVIHRNTKSARLASPAVVLSSHPTNACLSEPDITFSRIDQSEVTFQKPESCPSPWPQVSAKKRKWRTSREHLGMCVLHSKSQIWIIINRKRSPSLF